MDLHTSKRSSVVCLIIIVVFVSEEKKCLSIRLFHREKEPRWQAILPIFLLTTALAAIIVILVIATNDTSSESIEKVEKFFPIDNISFYLPKVGFFK